MIPAALHRYPQFFCEVRICWPLRVSALRYDQRSPDRGMITERNCASEYLKESNLHTPPKNVRGSTPPTPRVDLSSANLSATRTWSHTFELPLGSIWKHSKRFGVRWVRPTPTPTVVDFVIQLGAQPHSSHRRSLSEGLAQTPEGMQQP